MSNIKLDGLVALKDYPLSELYRLVVPGKFHKSGCGWVESNDHEEGSLKAAFNGLGFAITRLEDNLTAELIQELHRAFTTDVNGLSKNNIPGKLRDKCFPTVFGIRELSRAGMADLLIMINKQSDYPQKRGTVIGERHPECPGLIKFGTEIDYHQLKATQINLSEEFITDTHKRLTGKIYYMAPIPGVEFYKHWDSIINSYNEKILQAKTDEEKLEVIVEHIWEFELLHTFNDGNSRTYIIGLLTRFLLQNGFPPATLKDLGTFHGLSKKELVQVVKEGIKLTREIIAGNTKMIFGFNSADIPKEYQKEYSEIVKSFKTTVEEVYSSEYEKKLMTEKSEKNRMLPDTHRFHFMSTQVSNETMKMQESQFFRCTK